MTENKDKLEGTDVAALESLIKEGRSAIESQDDAKVQDVLARLEKEAHAMASKLYEAAGGGPGGAAPGPNGSPPPGAGRPAEPEKKKGGDVIDAEFEESN